MVRRITLTALIALSALSAGCSLAVKGGIHSYLDSEFEDLKERSSLEVWELEFGVSEFRDKQIDLSVSLDVPDAMRQTDFMNLRLTSRYHFRRKRRLSPYAGIGVGYYRWSTAAVVFVPEPYCYTEIDPYGCERLKSQTLSSGFFPHGVVGLGVRIRKGISVIVEDRVDFAKDDGAFDFDSNQLAVGCRIDLRR
jgi:hypothetical protein